MRDFQEIAEKVLKGELSGRFRLFDGTIIQSSILRRNPITPNHYIILGHNYDRFGTTDYLPEDSFISNDVINFISDMKQERNVKLTLEKAKEWYKKGGELKEVALQAFNEEELKDSKPRSWEEYCKNSNRADKFIIRDDSSIEKLSIYWHNNKMISDYDKNLLPSKELAEAFLAMMQLMSLRQAWIGDWKPNWKDESARKWCITLIEYEFKVELYWANTKSLSFPTEKMATDFMNCFKDLLEIAKPLI